jgi:AraC-like DNA-binding protein
MTPQDPQPVLPFENARVAGNPSNQSSRDLRLCEQEPLKRRASDLKLGLTRLALTSHTAAVVKRDKLPYATFNISTSAECRYEIDGRRYFEQLGKTAVFLSGAPCTVKTDTAYTGVQVVLDEKRLTQIANTMLGSKRGLSKQAFKLDQDREISLIADGIPFSTIFNSCLRTIKIMGKHPKALGLLGMDDVLYRAFAILLAPELFGAQIEAGIEHADYRLEPVCNYILINLERPLRLTDLERISGMSRRSLQYAFMKKFACTPMQWVRRERLSLAYKKLSNAAEGATVTAIALSCGFENLSMFSENFKKRFGKLPRQVLVSRYDLRFA